MHKFFEVNELVVNVFEKIRTYIKGSGNLAYFQRARFCQRSWQQNNTTIYAKLKV